MEQPAAEFQAHKIEVRLEAEGRAARLILASSAQTLSVTMPRAVLNVLYNDIGDILKKPTRAPPLNAKLRPAVT
jgi:hypothetical protein